MLSVNQLHQQIKEREKKKKSVYDKVLKLCYERIMYVNQKSDNCFCYFSCPEYVYGLPLYNITNCTIYIMEDLIKRGFKVQYTNPNLLYIDWTQEVPEDYNTSRQTYKPQLEYNQYRDIMELEQNKNLLIGNTNINKTYQQELDEINNPGFLDNLF